MKLSWIIFVLIMLITSSFKLRLGRIQGIRSNILRKMQTVAESIKMPTILVPISHGSEELETITIVDTLARGGAKVIIAAVNSSTLQVRCSRGVNIVADTFLSDCLGSDWDMIVCPGGMPGAQHLHDCSKLIGLLEKQHNEKKYIAAICAAPAVVLGKIAPEHRMTCYPAPKFVAKLGERYTPDMVVVDGHVITSQGPGTALEFSLTLVNILFGEEKGDQIRKEMIA